MAYNGPGDAQEIGYTGGAAGVVGSLIGAGAGLYDSYQNRKTSIENTKRTIAAQKAEAELAYQRSVQERDYMNWYNTPEQQMKRFLDAGLNPHLIYDKGSSGQQSSPASYQAANLQYKYEAPTYGAAIQSILPLLMSVGTWMQNMRATEAGIRKTEVDTNRSSTETERARQLIDFLMERNPQVLKEGKNRLSLFPYQADMQRSVSQKAYLDVADLEQKFRYDYGDELFRLLRFDPRTPGGASGDVGGVKRLQFLQEQSKTKLLDAKSSWSDFDITDPQALMQLVLSGVMGLAGSTLKMKSSQSYNAKQRQLDRRHDMTKGRINQRRRSY